MPVAVLDVDGTTVYIQTQANVIMMLNVAKTQYRVS